MKKRLCCFILDKSKSDERCLSLAVREIWVGDSKRPSNFIYTCEEHLEETLDNLEDEILC